MAQVSNIHTSPPASRHPGRGDGCSPAIGGETLGFPFESFLLSPFLWVLHLDRRFQHFPRKKLLMVQKCGGCTTLEVRGFIPLFTRFVKYSSLLKFYSMKNGPLPNYSWLGVVPCRPKKRLGPRKMVAYLQMALILKITPKWKKTSVTRMFCWIC